MKDILALSLKDVPLLCMRTINVLNRNGIETLGDLVSQKHSDLLKIRDLGRRSLNEIEVAMENLGFQYSPINNQSLMANKPTKPIRLAPQTKEEQEMQIARFFANKREQFAINILANIVKGNAFAYPKDQDKESFLAVTELAVEMADRLLEKLYPVKLEDKK